MSIKLTLTPEEITQMIIDSFLRGMDDYLDNSEFEFKYNEMPNNAYEINNFIYYTKVRLDKLSTGRESDAFSPAITALITKTMKEELDSSSILDLNTKASTDIDFDVVKAIEKWDRAPLWKNVSLLYEYGIFNDDNVDDDDIDFKIHESYKTLSRIAAWFFGVMSLPLLISADIPLQTSDEESL